MSDPNINDPLMILDKETNEQEINYQLQHLDDLIADFKQGKDTCVPTKIPEPTIRWRKRDRDGNELYARPRSTRNQSTKTGHSQKTRCPSNNIQCEVAYAPETVARLVPVETPVRIYDCPSECLRIKPGKAVAMVTINGHYDLRMPELVCEACDAAWTSGVHDLSLSDYWPATLHFSTLN
ncbi:hypothetical protein CRENBAI_008546 [Crenichthys baileyi]|uniref:CxC3 like cysteine cluster domain-containing protein n=1 Tax=Crenichthys baileyi TaxID=28760 RepID=A0AAV9S5E4_9TELE